MFKLTGRHATDYSNASRTLLFDTDELAWDPELCELLGVPDDSLPEACPSAHVYGETDAFGGSVPVAGIAGDQQAALYGQACHTPGLGKNTYGTGSFVLQNAGTSGRSRRRACSPRWPGGSTGRVDYALEAAIFVTGAAVQWLRDGLGIIEKAGDTEALARSLDSNDGVYLVPAFTGLGSPHWDPYARGTIVGLTRGSGVAHLARATLEAIAYQTVDAVRAMEARLGRGAGGAQGRRRRGAQLVADALPGRRARRAGGGAGDLGDHGARRRLPGRRGHGTRGPRRTCARCGARPRATSRGWPSPSASGCSPSGLARWSARAAGHVTNPDEAG